MKHDLAGVWLSEQLEKVPDYACNFTNWIDCIYYPGKIKLIISEEPGSGLTMEVHAPAKYYGGLEGFLRVGSFRVDEEYACIRSMNIGTPISNIFMKASKLIIEQLFELKLTFEREGKSTEE